jgi:type I restriction-modification system DNA methylase subunit
MLETWLWDAACAIRGSTDAPKFKDFILPLVFFKRLSDVFDDELLDMSRSTEMKPSPGRLSRQTLLRYKDVPVKRTTNLNYI